MKSLLHTSMCRMPQLRWRRCSRVHGAGKLTMKMRLHSNALSRQVPGIMICDQCGTEEALDAMAGKPKDAHEWALVKIYMKGANLK